MSDGKVQFQGGGGISVTIIQILLPVVLAIIAGYGTVKFTEGSTIQRLQSLDQRIEENRQQIEQVRANSVSKDEMKFFVDQIRQDLSGIKEDIRDLNRNKR